MTEDKTSLLLKQLDWVQTVAFPTETSSDTQPVIIFADEQAARTARLALGVETSYLLDDTIRGKRFRTVRLALSTVRALVEATARALYGQRARHDDLRRELVS